MIPSSRSLLSRDKRLPLDTWKTSGLQENVFGNQFSTFDSPRDHSLKNSLLRTTKRTRSPDLIFGPQFHLFKAKLIVLVAEGKHVETSIQPAPVTSTHADEDRKVGE